MHPLAPKMVNELPPQLAKMVQMFQTLAADAQLAKAVEIESQKRAVEFLHGVYRYHETPFARDVIEPASVLSIGAARLLDYGGKGIPILLVPSLINRYYILDLSHKQSFARYLNNNGMRVFVIDWGVPGEKERHYNCALYVTEVMAHMAEWIYTQVQRQLVVGGYCMGGLLALALAQTRPDLVAGLGLLATPWDFLVPGFPRIACFGNVALLEQYIGTNQSVPAETLHQFFHSVNPMAFQTKFREFASMDAKDPSTLEFLAIEHWVNDGVPMTSGAARDCLIEWTQNNVPARGKWYVGGQAVSPERLSIPCFAAVPRDDKIVPSECALALTKLLKNCHVIEPPCGHVGMLAGRRRKAGLWDPFIGWVKSQFP
jgi:poly(3-hydroxyalkanoate) synthetase